MLPLWAKRSGRSLRPPPLATSSAARTAAKARSTG
nr:MAG TPA: hypothetical protein [Caudoviricetes sp.]